MLLKTESLYFLVAVANPAQRVQFLLGEEEDEEHKSHDLFCEMEELFYNGDQIEWKESARFVSHF